MTSPPKRLNGSEASSTSATLPPRRIFGVFRPSHLGKYQGVGGNNAAWDASHQGEHRVHSDVVARSQLRTCQQSSSTAMPHSPTSRGDAADQDDSERKLFVSNLPCGCTEEKLHNYFNKHVGAEVEDVSLLKNKRKAHVLLCDPEAVEIAVQGEHYIDGQKLFIESGRGAANPSHWERKLFVSNLPNGCTEEKLRDYFSNEVWGEVEDVSLLRDMQNQPNGKAHVLFYDREAVGMALQTTHYINGQRLQIEPSRQQITKLSKKRKHNAEPVKKPGTARCDNAAAIHQASGAQERKIFVDCVPDACTSEQLYDYFSTLAPVEDAVVMSDQQTNKSRGCGYVLFQDKEGQELAMETFSAGLLEIDGNRLRVRKWSAEGRKKGWVTGIALSCTEAELCDAFSQYGEVEKVDVRRDYHTGQPKGIAFVTFVNAVDLDRALEDNCKLVQSYSRAFSKTTRIQLSEVSTSKREKQKRKQARRQARRRLKNMRSQESDSEGTGSVSG